MYRRVMDLTVGHDNEQKTEECRSEVCRYCRAMEKTLLWEDFTFFINLYLFIALNVTTWLYDVFDVRPSLLPFNMYFMTQGVIAFKFMDDLAPAAEHQRVCSWPHWLWKNLLKLRSKKPGLHCAILCLVAFGLWLLGRHVDPVILWSIIIAALSLPLPLKMSNKMRDGMSYVIDYVSHRGWTSDSEIEDEFLPVVTEANLQVLNRVGETGDQSPTPTSVHSDTQNDSFYDEDFIEGLQEIAYHGEGSTDGVELSELELSVGENDAEEDGIKFQTGHFEKSSSSSSEEEVFEGKKIIAVSSDESNGDSDFEIIDKEEIAKIEM